MGDGQKARTLGEACVEALVAVKTGEKLDGAKSFERYQMAIRLQKGGEIDLKSEEIAELKARVGEMYGPVIVGPVFILLEGGK